MIVYSVDNDEAAIEGVAYFTNKAQAFARARQIAAEGNESTVESNVIRPDRGRDAICALLNRSGFVTERAVVRVFPAKEVKGP